MFEQIADSLMKEYLSLIHRLDAGKKAIEEFTEYDEQYNEYVKHYNYLKAMATRASACIDILNGDVDLIAEHGGNLVVIRKLDVRGQQLIEEAQKLGGIISKVGDGEQG